MIQFTLNQFNIQYITKFTTVSVARVWAALPADTCAIDDGNILYVGRHNAVRMELSSIIIIIFQTICWKLFGGRRQQHHVLLFSSLPYSTTTLLMLLPVELHCRPAPLLSPLIFISNVKCWHRWTGCRWMRARGIYTNPVNFLHAHIFHCISLWPQVFIFHWIYYYYCVTLLLELERMHHLFIFAAFKCHYFYGFHHLPPVRRCPFSLWFQWT